jgi:hypothetical protein
LVWRVSPPLSMVPSQQSIYDSAAYNAAGSAMMSFDPLNKIHQHLCAFHTYSLVELS